MSKAHDGRRRGAGLWILAASMIGIPAVQLASGRIGSPIWDVLTFTILGAGVVLLVLIPRFSAGWARGLLNRELSRGSGMRGALIQVSDGHGSTQLVVLLADNLGLRIIGRVGPIWAVAWTDVAEVRVVNQAFAVEAPMIAAIASDGAELHRFLPLRSGGWGPASGWDADALARDLERCRKAKLPTPDR